MKRSNEENINSINCENQKVISNENMITSFSSEKNSDDYDKLINSGNFSNKTISRLTEISKKLSSSFDENENSNDEYNVFNEDNQKKDITDITEIIDEKNKDENGDDYFDDKNITINENQTQEPKKLKFYFKSTLYIFLFVFSFTFISFTYMFNYVFIPIQVVGISMQPTINLSVDDNGYYEGNLDKTHCDIVYYNKDKSYQNNDIVIISNNGYVNSTSSSQSSDGNTETTKVDYLIKRVVATEFQTIKFIKTGSVTTTITYKVEVYDKNGVQVSLDTSFEKNGEEMMFYHGMPEGQKNFFPFFYEIFSAVERDGEFSYIVPENEYFVMGDNRNNSTDSRYFGTVKYEDIAGEVKIIVPYKQNLLKSIFVKIKSYF